MASERDRELLEWLKRVEDRMAHLPADLQAHVARARTVGRELSVLFGAPAARVDLALAGHDLFRAMTNEQWLMAARRVSLHIDEHSAIEPVLLHGPLAAAWMAGEAGVTDRQVLDAVRCHTTFAPGLGVLAATVFLADKIDPDKLRRRPWLAGVDRLARSGDWRAGIVAYLRRESEALQQRGAAVHPDAVAALDELSG